MFRIVCFLLALLTGYSVSAFLANPTSTKTTTHNHQYVSSTTKINLFDKMFEEEGMLGKGITVGKVQVALRSSDRSDTSIFGLCVNLMTGFQHVAQGSGLVRKMLARQKDTTMNFLTLKRPSLRR
jgi:hypothetical protein